MESGKLRHALDQILRRCKAAGHRLHVFDPSDISHEEVVGRGEEGIVQLCKVNFHGLQEYAAIKTITTNGGKEMLDFLLQELELVVMGSDSLANAVLKVFGVVLVPVNLKTRSHHSAMCHLGIVMERGLCNLYQLLVREELDLYLRLDLMRQLARALHHLHTGDPHIIHRDVKPQNVVVTEAERSERTGLLKNVKVKLIDLGMACAVRHLEEKVSSVVGTEGYHAPEMWEEQPYTHKVDIFSLGVTFLVVLLRRDSLSKINCLLESLHEAKVEGQLGKKLFALADGQVISDVDDLPDLKSLLFAMLSGAASRLSDAGYIYNELTRVLTDATPSSRMTVAQTPVISIKSCSRLPRRSKVSVDGASPTNLTPLSKSTMNGSTSNGESVDCRSKDSDYSSLDSEQGGSKRSNTPITPSCSVRESNNNNDDNWQMPKFRNFYTQTPNSDKYKCLDTEDTDEALNGTGLKGKRGSNSRLTVSTSTTTLADRDDQIEALEKQLDKKQSALSVKDQLLIDKDKRLVEQRKSLQKLEVQNKELRQQLALSKAKNTPIEGRFNPITKQIRPRSLFPDGGVEVKSEPVVMTQTRLAEVAGDKSETESLTGAPGLGRSKCSAALTNSAKDVYAVGENKCDGCASPQTVEKIKVEHDAINADTSVNASAVSTCREESVENSDKTNNTNLPSKNSGKRSTRKRKIQVEASTTKLEATETMESQSTESRRRSGRIGIARATRRNKEAKIDENNANKEAPSEVQELTKAKENDSQAERDETFTHSPIVDQSNYSDIGKPLSSVTAPDPKDESYSKAIEPKPDTTMDTARLSVDATKPVVTPEIAPPPLKRARRSTRRASPSLVESHSVSSSCESRLTTRRTRASVSDSTIQGSDTSSSLSIEQSDLDRNTSSIASSSSDGSSSLKDAPKGCDSLKPSITPLEDDAPPTDTSVPLVPNLTPLESPLAPRETSEACPTSLGAALSVSTAPIATTALPEASMTLSKPWTTSPPLKIASVVSVSAAPSVGAVSSKLSVPTSSKISTSSRRRLRKSSRGSSLSDNGTEQSKVPRTNKEVGASRTLDIGCDDQDVSLKGNDNECAARVTTEPQVDMNSIESNEHKSLGQSDEQSFESSQGIAGGENRYVDDSSSSQLGHKPSPFGLKPSSTPPPLPLASQPDFDTLGDNPTSSDCDKNEAPTLETLPSLQIPAANIDSSKIPNPSRHESMSRSEVSGIVDTLSKSVRGDDKAPQEEEPKDFHKIFGSKTYTGRRLNKSPFVSPIRSPIMSGSHSTAAHSPSFAGNMLVLTSPPAASPPIHSQSICGSCSSPLNTVTGPARVASPPPADLIKVPIEASPSDSAAGLSANLPSVRHKRDIPNLNWVIGAQTSPLKVESKPRPDGNVVFNGDPSRFKGFVSVESTKCPFAPMQMTPAQTLAPTLTSPRIITSKNSQASPKYHFVPSNRPLALSPNRRPSVIMRHVPVADDHSPHEMDGKTSDAKLKTSSISDTKLVPSSSASSAATEKSTLSHSPLSPMRFVPLSSSLAGSLLPSLSSVEESLRRGQSSSSSSTHSSSIAHLSLATTTTVASTMTTTTLPLASNWINSDFFTLPLVAANELNLERDLRPSLASPRPSLRNGQNGV